MVISECYSLKVEMLVEPQCSSQPQPTLRRHKPCKTSTAQTNILSRGTLLSQHYNHGFLSYIFRSIPSPFTTPTRNKKLGASEIRNWGIN